MKNKKLIFRKPILDIACKLEEGITEYEPSGRAVREIRFIDKDYQINNIVQYKDIEKEDNEERYTVKSNIFEIISSTIGRDLEGEYVVLELKHLKR